MKCLTRDESQKWLDLEGFEFVECRYPRSTFSRLRLMATVPNGSLKLYYFCLHVVDCLPETSNLLLLISQWETYPAEQLMFFEMLRHQNGNSKTLIDAPGHLFTGKVDSEKALLVGLIFLMIAFNWEGYLIASRQTYVYF